MITQRASKLVVAAFGAALSMSACVENVVIGDQKEPVILSDAGDAEPEPDAEPASDAGGGEPDAESELDAGPDAEPPQDAAASSDASPADAAPDEGCPVVVYWFDGTDGGAGCVGAGCVDAGDAGALDPSCEPPRGPCSVCGGVSILAMPADACPNGAPAVCWQDDAINCSVQCPETPTCRKSSDCAPDQYCFFAKSDCGAAELGWCAPRPRGDCPLLGPPACGCDGQRYENGCFATQAGVHTADAAHALCQ